MDVSYGTVDDKRDSIAVGNTMAYNNVFCSEYGKKQSAIVKQLFCGMKKKGRMCDVCIGIDQA